MQNPFSKNPILDFLKEMHPAVLLIQAKRDLSLPGWIHSIRIVFVGVVNRPLKTMGLGKLSSNFTHLSVVSLVVMCVSQS